MHEHRVPAGDDETANCSAAATTLRASFAVALMCLALAAGPALAATFAVDSTTDAVDDNPGTGTFGTTIIDGRNATQIFNVQGGTVRLDNLVLRRAFLQFNDPGIFGACVGPALFVAGTGVVVNVTGIVIQNNAAINGSWGGICVYSGTLNLDRSSVLNNTATFGGGIRVLFAPGTLNVTTSTISGNTASSGGSGVIALVGTNPDSGKGCGFASPGDLVDTDPLLGPLVNDLVPEKWTPRGMAA